MVSGQKFLAIIKGSRNGFGTVSTNKTKAMPWKVNPQPQTAQTGAIKTVGLVPGFGVPALGLVITHIFFPSVS